MKDPAIERDLFVRLRRCRVCSGVPRLVAYTVVVRGEHVFTCGSAYCKARAQAVQS